MSDINEILPPDWNEEKEMIKADMDYLKDMIKYLYEQGPGSSAVISLGSDMGFPGAFEPAGCGINISVQC